MVLAAMWVRLYGARELIEAQGGYSFDPITTKPLNDWPQNFVVIADDGGDPFCIDIAKTANNDVPVFHGLHGHDAWKFKQYAGSFMKFLEILAKA